MNGLTVLRQLFLSFSSALVLITVVAVILSTSIGHVDPPTSVSMTIVIVVGLASLIAGRRARRELDCRTDRTLADSYRQRFFLRLAFAESAALIGFAISIAIGPWWAYFVALAFTVAGFARLAPTRRNLTLDQQHLGANGCHRSLADALVGTTIGT